MPFVICYSLNVLIRRRPKGSPYGGGRFAPSQRCDQVKSGAPLKLPKSLRVLESPSTSPETLAWERAGKDARKAFGSYARALNKSHKSGDRGTPNPKVTEALVAATRAREFEIRLRRDCLGMDLGEERVASAHEIHVIICNCCGSVETRTEHPSLGDLRVDKCQSNICHLSKAKR